MPGRAAQLRLVMATAALAAIMAVSLVPPSGPPPARTCWPNSRHRIRPWSARTCAVVRWSPACAATTPHRPGSACSTAPPWRNCARTSLHSPSPRLRGLAALEQMQESGPASSAAVPCIGDGTSGNRVQVVSGRSPTIPDRYASLLPAFRQWAAQVDQAVWLSAGETGGRPPPAPGHRQRLPAPSRPGAGDPGRGGQLRPDAHRAAGLGYNRSDRKYLVWVDAAVGICGLGESMTTNDPPPATPTTPGRCTPAWTLPAGTMPSSTRSSTPWAPCSPTPPSQRRPALHRRGRRHVL
jgi:hypothetical protein